MNILEQNTEKNYDNYQLYLQRMANSCQNSSKHLIPFYTNGYNTILDVGCADGTLMELIKQNNPTARVIGIDLNKNAIYQASLKGLEVYYMALENVKKELNIEFDCIIFSSVLHEISSYAEKNKFTFKPIKNALEHAYSLLKENGQIIIRDGLLDDCNNTICNLHFLDFEKDSQWFFKFVNEFKDVYVDFNYQIKKNNDIICHTELAQEFLATWTWGENSWSREIQEKFCILSESLWTRIVEEVGFNIISFSKSKEEYPKYLKSKVILFDSYYDKQIFPYMTCMIIAKKI